MVSSCSQDVEAVKDLVQERWHRGWEMKETV